MIKTRLNAKSMWPTLSDKRMLGVPLALFTLLQRATPLQLSDNDLSPRGIHWDELKEDLSLDGLLSPIPLAAS